MSLSKQVGNFKIDFVKHLMQQWTESAQVYEREAEKYYTKMRSYLTMYQFRLSDQDKCEIREMLSQSLDEIEKNNVIEDMDNYLDGFCFKIDKSVLSKCPPKEVKIAISPEPKQPLVKPVTAPVPITYTFDSAPDETKFDTIDSNQTFVSESPFYEFSDNAFDLDFYTQQFF